MASLRRRFCMCLCLCLCHLLAAAAAVGVADDGGDCYKTVTSVPKDCGGQFIQAIFTGDKKYITQGCCILLACVREWSCADTLVRFCPPPEAHDCPPPPAPAPPPPPPPELRSRTTTTMD